MHLVSPPSWISEDIQHWTEATDPCVVAIDPMSSVVVLHSDNNNVVTLVTVTCMK